MKRFYYGLLGIAAFSLVSCSQEDLGIANEGDSANYHFNISLPKNFSARASGDVIGDGAQATSLQVLLYTVTSSSGQDTYTYVSTSEFEFTDDSANVDLNLVANKSYKIAFFASSSTALTAGSGASAVYDIDTSNGDLTVNYNQMTSAGNVADAYDCFFGNYETGVVGGKDIQDNVTLTRPMAQVNWGTTTTALTNAATTWGQNGAFIQTTFNASNVPNTLNLLSGAVSGSTSVTMTNFASPSANTGDNPTATYPVTGYTYIAYQYLLANETSSNYNLDLTVSNNGNSNTGTETIPLKVSNAPLQANYQTNIYGSLLAANAAFTVTKTSTFAGSDPVNVWDGSTVTTPMINETTKEVYVNQASDLVGLAYLVNGQAITSTRDDDPSPNSFEGYTINLNDDFDMNGEEFPIIGSATRNGTNVTGNLFQGIFDGQGHTISNLKIESDNSGDVAVGFIAGLSGANSAVKNLNFDNLTINGKQSEMVGTIGAVIEGATVSNVNVLQGSSINGKSGVGAIVGRMLFTGTISDCDNYATVTSTGNNTGGIVGAAYYTSTSGVMTISGCNNYAAISGQGQAVAGIAGLCAANVSNCNNTGNVTSTGQGTGGIVGQQTYYGTVSECENTGNVTGTGYGTGGIAGWVRYNASVPYDMQAPIQVLNCKNSGEIYGVTGGGGIVGVWYMCGVCNGNTNNSTKISALTQWASGIIGGMQWTETGPANVAAANNYLFLENNTTTTTMAQLDSPLKNLLIYVNSSQNLKESNNTIPQ